MADAMELMILSIIAPALRLVPNFDIGLAENVRCKNYDSDVNGNYRQLKKPLFQRLFSSE